MRYWKIKYGLAAAVILVAILATLYLETSNRVHDFTSLSDIDTTAKWVGAGLSTGDIYCTDAVVINLKYANDTVAITTKGICDRLR